VACLLPGLLSDWHSVNPERAIFRCDVITKHISPAPESMAAERSPTPSRHDGLRGQGRIAPPAAGGEGAYFLKGLHSGLTKHWSRCRSQRPTAPVVSLEPWRQFLAQGCRLVPTRNGSMRSSAKKLFSQSEAADTKTFEALNALGCQARIDINGPLGGIRNAGSTATLI
jgi:hypothetical protein